MVILGLFCIITFLYVIILDLCTGSNRLNDFTKRSAQFGPCNQTGKPHASNLCLCVFLGITVFS